MELFRKTARVSKSSTLDRDFLIYTAWQLGVATNQQIGEKFGLTYSSVSQRARVIKEKLQKDKSLPKKYQHLKSIMKI
jgi:chromosomal replication initiation ATPase DnaA